MKKKIDYNSVENQEIKRKFVEREVICLFNEIETLLNLQLETLNSDLPSYDDIENFCQYICPECGQGYQEEVHATSCCNSKDEPQNEPQEIYEYWLVSEYLGNKLKAKGEPVLEWGLHLIWGRTTTGQAILLDGVISEICEDMEILEGQKYSWKEGK